MDAINEWVPNTSEIPPPYTFEPREKEEGEEGKLVVDDDAVHEVTELFEMV